MAVVFPLTPAPNQVVTDPATNATWRWDAPTTRWVPAATGGVFVTPGDLQTALDDYVPLTGGTMQGPLALQGITNSVSAPAGQVGEYLTQTFQGQTLNMSQSTTTVIGTLMLSPGYWMVNGCAFLDSNPNNNTITAGYGWVSPITTDDPNTAGRILTGMATTANVSSLRCPCGPLFLNWAVSGPVYLCGYIFVTGGGVNGNGFMTATRIA